jgi:RNA polymerase sigma factor (sigma-70 family)
MAPKPTDWDLLGRYTASTDADAFAELVRRHIGFVYALARRQTRGDVHLAEDITQAVMIVLARKAGTIQRGEVLTGWLFTVTRHAARNALKMRARQQYHERRAAAGRTEVVAAASDAQELEEVLGEAIARLPATDRSGVLLHYFQGQAHDEVAAVLGLSPHAARKRVSRALEKMRGFLAGRGVAFTGAVMLDGLRAEMTTVPAALVDSSINVAMLSGAGAAQTSASSLAIAKTVTHVFAMAKLKVAATIALVVTGIAGATAIPLVNLASRTVTTTATTLLAEPATQPADPKLTTEPLPGIRIEFLGVSPCPGDENSWFTFAGDPIDLPDPRVLENNVTTTTAPDHQWLIHITKPPATVIVPNIEGATMSSHNNNDTGGELMLHSRFVLANPAEVASLRLGISTTGWQTIAESDQPDQPVNVESPDYGPITLMPPGKDDMVGGTRVDVHHRTIDAPYHLLAFDEKGQQHVSHNVNNDSTNDDWVSSYTFDLPQDAIKKVQFQVRAYDKFVDVKNICLNPQHKTIPQVTVTDAKKRK